MLFYEKNSTGISFLESVYSRHFKPFSHLFCCIVLVMFGPGEQCSPYCIDEKFWCVAIGQ